jgi:aminopeptidase N
MKRIIILLAFIWGISSGYIYPQTYKLPPEHFAPNKEFDMLNINLYFHFNLEKKELLGKAVGKIIPLRTNYKAVHLDAVDMKIKKVKINGKIVPFQYNGKILTIELNKTYGLKDTLTYTVIYSTIPKKGLFFIRSSKAYPNRSPQIWSQSEMEDARYWFPSHDYPDDFLTSSVTATVPYNWKVVSNGILKKVKDNKKLNEKTYYWVENKPHVIYLISIVAGKYKIFKDKFKNIPLYYYVQPKYAKYAEENLSSEPDILNFYSKVTGYLYPWGKLSLTTVSDFTFGGMENVSAITLTDNTLHNKYAEPEVSSVGLIAHETAHQWFGDLLTCRNWSNAWLNEGFATYFEALYRKHAFGKNAFSYEMMNDYKSILRADKKLRRPTVFNRYNAPVDLFNVYIYQRGASILNMMRHILGDKLFFKAIKYYVHRFQFQNVDTHNFENTIFEATGYNLHWFFNEWLYKGGHPVFDVNYKYNPKGHKLTLFVKQVQKTDRLTPIYKTPVDVYIVTPTRKILKRIHLNSKISSFVFNLDKKPLMVNFDQGNWLLKEMNFKKSEKELLYQLKNDPSVSGRIWAAEQLNGFSNDSSESGLISSLKHDPFWGVRSAVAGILGKYKNKQAEEALITSLNDNDKRVQVSAIQQLANFKNAKSVSELKKMFDKSSNYFVRSAAVYSLAKADSLGALPIIKKASWIKSYNAVIRISALRALYRIDPQKAYLEAVELSRPGEPQNLRIRAIDLFSKIKPKSKKTIKLLENYIADPYLWVRKTAVYALGRVGSKKDLKLLMNRENIEFDNRIKETVKNAILSIEKKLKM